MAYEEYTDWYEDVLLSYNDVQLLSSREGVAAFFSTLHYNTDQRVEQTISAMGFTSENLRSAIKYIERVAFHEDFDSFSIYLFELNRLTVAIRNEIVRGFRNRPGNYLLVLTEDYERLDFVLVERYTQIITTQEETYEVQSLLPGNKPALVRPRVLQVERRAPGDVELRVLRRFTYTESDTIAQYEKLLNAYIVAAWSEPFFNNRALFSDYYLTKRFPEEKEWNDELARNELRRAFRNLLALYDDARENCHNQPEPVIWKRLLGPVFQGLGFAPRHVNASSKEPALNSYYRLFAASSSIAASEKPLAICLTYPWERNLDGKDDQRDSQTPDENPGAVVVTLLDAGEADWAIVTNGVIWRLYAAKAHSRATNYYEINLQETLALDPSKREEAFRYFWLFFRAAAFIPTERIVEGEKRSLSLLDDLLLQSDLHARELGERLKNRVFEEIFPHFALGFVHHARLHHLLPPHLDTLDAEERSRLLEPYFTGTLTFLYRLLFLFYAESRDLLPVRQEHSYHEHSLERLKQEIKNDAGDLQDRVASNLASYSESSTAIYDRLTLLFAAVDKGNAALNVPIYNGGLFMTNPPPQTKDEAPEITVARFLKEHKITDRQLALGLDRMARDVDEKLSKARLATGEANDYSHSLIFIDYKSLGVRHLGSIYEGLLEFKLRIAPETMAVVEGKRTEEIIPYSEARQQNRRILKVRQGRELKERLYAKGTVYLENDRRERKATGSYYTPDYIVQYIVEQTVGPILKDKLENLRSVFRAAQDYLKNDQNRLKALHRTDTDSEHNTYKAYRISLNEAFFDLKVLDPAMGSGHFLVEVVDYITDQMAKFLNGFRWNPVVYELALTRKKIEDGMREQGVTVDRDKLTDLNLLKRRVLKSCVYGVDVNPMAVELAKVSLWLDCFTLGAPLSFLDHHMKCGNSLMGGDVKVVQQAVAGSLTGWRFSGMLEAAHMMRKVSTLSDVTAQEVKESQETYHLALDELAPYKRVLDVWLSEYFGNKSARQIAADHVNAIIENEYGPIDKNDRAVIEAGVPLASSKRFFHWELEFPEVFFDEAKRKENGGFDAVLGNPPYFAISTNLSAQDILYLQQGYSEVFTGNSDVLYYFLSLISKLLKRGAFQGMIVSRYFQEAKYAERLRKYLTYVAELIQLVDFQNFQVFGAEVNVLASIVFLKKSDNDRENRVRVLRLKNDKLKEKVLSMNLLGQNATFFDKFESSGPVNGEVWNFIHIEDNILFDKLHRCSILLGSIANIVQSMQTGLNEVLAPHVRTILEHSIEKDLIHPIAKSGSILRYEFEPLDNVLIWTQGIDIDKYPHAKRYLLPFKDALAARYDIRSRKANWWEISTPRNAELFLSDRPRILVPFVATGNKFCVDDEKRLNDGGDIRAIFFSSDSRYSEFYTCAVLNSKVCQYYHLKNTKLKRGGYYEYFEGQLSALPIRRINFITSPSERDRYRDKARLLYQQCMSKGDQDCVLGFVDHHLSKEPEESDVVHDLLAFLAEEMLRLNKEKRALQKAFLDYFVDVMQVKSVDGKTGIEVLTGKSKLLEFVGDYQKGEEPLSPVALWEIVQKNRSRLNAGRVGLKERMLVHYQESLDQIVLLKEQLRRTDALIDQVVYRLYGLTEEEIAIVEGRG